MCTYTHENKIFKYVKTTSLTKKTSQPLFPRTSEVIARGKVSKHTHNILLSTIAYVALPCIYKGEHLLV